MRLCLGRVVHEIDALAVQVSLYGTHHLVIEKYNVSTLHRQRAKCDEYYLQEKYNPHK